MFPFERFPTSLVGSEMYDYRKYRRYKEIWTFWKPSTLLQDYVENGIPIVTTEAFQNQGLMPSDKFEYHKCLAGII